VPHLGTHAVQKLRAAHIAAWHATLLKRGSSEGEPLSARTVGHAHRVLHKALSYATKLETLSRNPAALVVPPKVEHGEVQILAADQVGTVLAVLRDTPLFAPVVVLLATGMRRGELMGLRWGDLDLDWG
jgi:integrase